MAPDEKVEPVRVAREGRLLMYFLKPDTRKREREQVDQSFESVHAHKLRSVTERPACYAKKTFLLAMHRPKAICIVIYIQPTTSPASVDTFSNSSDSTIFL